MKRLIRYSLLIACAGTLVMSCSKKDNWDATGTFEATEITVSSETAGKILYLNAEEGNTLTAGQVAGIIDTTQLYLQKLQLQNKKLRTGQTVSGEVLSIKGNEVELLLEKGGYLRAKIDSELTLLPGKL